jgi:large subunit ribosomal protein L20
MARVKRGVHAKKSHRAVLERAKGFKGARSRRFKAPRRPSTTRSGTPTATGARARATCAACGSRGSTRRLARRACPTAKLMHGLKLAEVEVDRKHLADLAVTRRGGLRRARRRRARGALDSDAA